MKQLSDFFPLLLFFILYKFYLDLPDEFILSINDWVPLMKLTPGKSTDAIYLATLAAIVGWQIAARGFPWLDRVLAVAVAVFVLVLAFQLFRRAVPILVDGAAVPPDELVAVLKSVEGVAGVDQVRSRWDGTRRTADVTVRVDPTLDAVQAHDIADEVEASLTIQLAFDEVLVHVEPDIGGGPPGEGQ